MLLKTLQWAAVPSSVPPLPSAVSLWPGSISAAAQRLAPAACASPPKTPPAGPPPVWRGERHARGRRGCFNWLYCWERYVYLTPDQRTHLSASCWLLSAWARAVLSSSLTLSIVSLSRWFVSIRSLSEWDRVPSWTPSSWFCCWVKKKKSHLFQIHQLPCSFVCFNPLRCLTFCRSAISAFCLSSSSSWELCCCSLVLVDTKPFHSSGHWPSLKSVEIKLHGFRKEGSCSCC